MKITIIGWLLGVSTAALAQTYDSSTLVDINNTSTSTSTSTSNNTNRQENDFGSWQERPC